MAGSRVRALVAGVVLLSVSQFWSPAAGASPGVGSPRGSTAISGRSMAPSVGFVANRGQFDPSVRFALRGVAASVDFTAK